MPKKPVSLERVLRVFRHGGVNQFSHLVQRRDCLVCIRATRRIYGPKNSNRKPPVSRPVFLAEHHLRIRGQVPIICAKLWWRNLSFCHQTLPLRLAGIDLQFGVSYLNGKAKSQSPGPRRINPFTKISLTLKTEDTDGFHDN